EGVIEAVGKFVACDDQVLAVASKATFHNCLMAMRPKAKIVDLPSTHNVMKYIHNQFVEWLKDLKKDITV
ncbi:hypothetical protein L208DRAFT_1069493, partial [Tricholoma matsutake]